MRLSHLLLTAALTLPCFGRIGVVAAADLSLENITFILSEAQSRWSRCKFECAYRTQVQRGFEDYAKDYNRMSGSAKPFPQIGFTATFESDYKTTYTIDGRRYKMDVLDLLTGSSVTYGSNGVISYTLDEKHNQAAIRQNNSVPEPIIPTDFIRSLPEDVRPLQNQAVGKRG